VEQATYHEYLNTSFPAESITCQKCHMPRIEDPIIIANGLSGLTPRTPFNQHTFQGANYFMLNLMKENKEALGITVEDWKYDTTLAATSRSLKQQSINLDLILDSLTADTAFFTVKLRNKAGHKFPSGYPSRRAVVQFVALSADNDTVFKSGIFGSDARVNNETPAFEPHHNVIKQSGKTQIYEMVMGDVNSNYTSTLERAAVMLKDNRIPPDGFTGSSSVYDTVAIVGVGADSDFNFENSIEGSGTDEVHYHVPVAGFSGNISAYARMYYQTVPPKFLDEMFALSTAPINTFRDMYDNADKQPFLMQHDSLLNVQLITGIHEQANEFNVYPSLTVDGRVSITSPNDINTITVYNTEGQLILSQSSTGRQARITLPETSGIYFIVVQTANKTFHRKVLRQ
ncbi:MAG: T9SS type A sorting domain-containing protein, partial [Bacteroidia bacterium]